MGTNGLRPYLRITTPDERHFVWVKQPDMGGRTYFTCDFDLNTGFADKLDGLEYITVESISRLMDGMCIIVARFNRDTAECLNRLIEDLPEIMDGMDLDNHLIPSEP